MLTIRLARSSSQAGSGGIIPPKQGAEVSRILHQKQTVSNEFRKATPSMDPLVEASLVAGNDAAKKELALGARAAGRVEEVAGIDLIGTTVTRKTGKKVHICSRCSMPIETYGRLEPCHHAFCLECTQSGASCHLCGKVATAVRRVEYGQGLFVCGAPGCLLSFLFKDLLVAHICTAHRLAPAVPLPLAGTSSAAAAAAASAPAQTQGQGQAGGASGKLKAAAEEKAGVGTGGGAVGGGGGGGPSKRLKVGEQPQQQGGEGGGGGGAAGQGRSGGSGGAIGAAAASGAVRGSTGAQGPEEGDSKAATVAAAAGGPVAEPGGASGDASGGGGGKGRRPGGAAAQAQQQFEDDASAGGRALPGEAGLGGGYYGGDHLQQGFHPSGSSGPWMHANQGHDGAPPEFYMGGRGGGGPGPMMGGGGGPGRAFLEGYGMGGGHPEGGYGHAHGHGQMYPPPHGEFGHMGPPPPYRKGGPPPPYHEIPFDRPPLRPPGRGQFERGGGPEGPGGEHGGYGWGRSNPAFGPPGFGGGGWSGP